jgi:hypothetical protein
MKGPYDEKDAAKDTDSSLGEVSEAWHTGREDSGRDESGYTVYSGLEDKTDLYESAKDNLSSLGLDYIMDLDPSEYGDDY